MSQSLTALSCKLRTFKESQISNGQLLSFSAWENWRSERFNTWPKGTAESEELGPVLRSAAPSQASSTERPWPLQHPWAMASTEATRRQRLNLVLSLGINSGLSFADAPPCPLPLIRSDHWRLWCPSQIDTEKAVRKCPVSQHNTKRGPRTLVLRFYTKIKVMVGERTCKTVCLKTNPFTTNTRLIILGIDAPES